MPAIGSFEKVVIGGILYDTAADIAQKLTSNLGIDIEADVAVVIAAWYLSKKYPEYKDYLAGVAASAASRALNIGALLGGGAQATQTAPQRMVFLPPRRRPAWGRLTIPVR